MQNRQNILEFRQITKSFPGVMALKRIDLAIDEAEVHVLVGENGAGKSSLIKILCGIYQPDGGEMFYAGSRFAPRNPLDAIRAGIRVVYQEFNLLSYLSVAENIFFERLPRKTGFLVDYRRLYQETERLLEMVGLELSPRTPVELLGVAQMQLIEIAKALSSESRVLVLDEPTATLTAKEINRLFAIIKDLRNRGVTVIYISHRLQEVFEIGDRITVLRNGMKVGTKAASEAGIADIVKMMVGKSMGEEYPFRSDVQPGEIIFQVEGLRCKRSPHQVSFSVRAGEILGIAGLVGSGRTETVRAIFGADAKEAGRLYLKGKQLVIKRPRDAVRQGICLLTEDRKNQGLILDMACFVNITLTDLARVSRAGLIQDGVERNAAETLVRELDIKTPSVGQWVRNLSGGNQQKVVLAKWLFRDANILIFDEPTRGIDVGAKYEIHLLLWKLAGLGKAIVLISSDLPELIGVCHRMLVFSNGKISGELQRQDFNQERILSLAYQEYIQHNH